MYVKHYFDYTGKQFICSFVFNLTWTSLTGNFGRTGTFNTTVDIKLKQWTESQVLDIWKLTFFYHENASSCQSNLWRLDGSVSRTSFINWWTWQRRRKIMTTYLTNSRGLWLTLRCLNMSGRTRQQKSSKLFNWIPWRIGKCWFIRILKGYTLAPRLRSVHDKQHWDGAIKFLSENLTEKIEGNDKTLAEMLGPGWWDRWTRWRRCARGAVAEAQGPLQEGFRKD